MAGGGIDTDVVLLVDGKEAYAVESYEIRSAIFTQPSAFSLQFGWGGILKDLLEQVKPGVAFELRLHGRTQFKGRIDGVTARGSASGAAITVRGRDELARVHDAYVQAARTFTDITFQGLVEEVLAAVYGDVRPTLFSSNAANRKAVTGAASAQTVHSLDKEANLHEVSLATQNAKRIQAKAGDRWYAILQRELGRAGLVFWAAANGDLVLSAPNTGQKPVHRFARRLDGQSREDVQVLEYELVNDTARRYSECVVFGRGGEAKVGTKRAAGRAADDEMAGYGFDRPIVLVDDHCHAAAKASFLARRTIAESRRENYALRYVIAGHRAPTLDGGLAVIGVDTTAQVYDEELGIDRMFYVESVAHRSTPQTTTEIVFVRPEDVLLGSDE